MVVGRLPFENSSKKTVTLAQRREIFLVEMKSGVKTRKHQTFMNAVSFRESLSI
jgi:hypothetical protein